MTLESYLTWKNPILRPLSRNLQAQNVYKIGHWCLLIDNFSSKNYSKKLLIIFKMIVITFATDVLFY